MLRRLITLLLVLIALPVAASVDYYLSVSSSAAPVDPGARVRITASVGSGCCPQVTEPTQATITIPLPPGSTNISTEVGAWACSVVSTTVTCTASLPAALPFPEIAADYNVPASHDGITFRGTATLATTVTDDRLGNNVTDVLVNTYRLLEVTTADDFGAGSLRDSIAAANVQCDGTIYCKMIFAGPMTIEPTSQLPAVTACSLIIDGGVASAASLDAPRPVEISGAKAGSANGLEIRSYCGVTLRGVTINGFSANGIVLAETEAPKFHGQWTIAVESCFIGTNSTATEARPNGMRGISVETPYTFAAISNCTISGNRYSGVAAWAASYVGVVNCRVGAGRDGRQLSNGASGVYFDSGFGGVAGGLIAYNHDFGVGVGPHADHVNVDYASLLANGIQDFDWGLDGPTRIDPAGRMPPAPVLLYASYDPARNVTTVRGVIPHEGDTQFRFTSLQVLLFEKTETGYKHRGNAYVPVRTGDMAFTVSTRGDLRGQMLVGESDSYVFADGPPTDSSELSEPVAVTPLNAHWRR
jgi:hypothetical protein